MMLICVCDDGCAINALSGRTRWTSTRLASCATELFFFFPSPGEAGQEYPLPDQQRGPGQDSDYRSGAAHQPDRGEPADSGGCRAKPPIQQPPPGSVNADPAFPRQCLFGINSCISIYNTILPPSSPRQMILNVFLTLLVVVFRRQMHSFLRPSFDQKCK